MNPVYCKYSNDRAVEYQIKTTIQIDENGKKSVCKYALTDAATGHVERLYQSYLRMKEGEASSVFEPNKCKRIEGGVEFEYVEGETLEQHLDKLYFDGKYLELVEEIKGFRDTLYSLPDNIPFCYTDGFDRVFGTGTMFFDEKSLRISNIDLVFGNIILGDRWTVIDYEWVFDFPVPVKYIFYRALHYYLAGSEKRKALQNIPVFQLLDISEEEIQMYTEMECSFQHYIEGGRCTMPVLKFFMLQRSVDVREAVSDRRTDILQIFTDTGEGYCEERSVSRLYDYRDKKIEAEVRAEENLKSLRVDPAVSAVVIKDFEAWGDGKRLQPTQSNGLVVAEGFYIFTEDDPQILFTGLGHVKKVTLKFSALELTGAWETVIGALLEKRGEQQEERNRLVERNRQLEETGRRLEEDQRELNRRLESLEAEKREAEAYIEYVNSRFIWRVRTKLRKLLRRK